eukprot:419082-Amphidinium_carterae.1
MPPVALDKYLKNHWATTQQGPPEVIRCGSVLPLTSVLSASEGRWTAWAKIVRIDCLKNYSFKSVVQLTHPHENKVGFTCCTVRELNLSLP